MRILIPREELLRNKPSEPGWYQCTITKSDVQQSKDKSGNNLVIVFRIDELEKEIPAKYFSLKPNGLMFMADFLRAVYGEGIEANPTTEFDNEDLIKKRLWVKIANETYEGNIKDAPAGYAHISKEMREIPF